MSTTAPPQTDLSSLDVTGISVATSAPSDNPRTGAAFDPLVCAGAAPLWFHPMPGGGHIMVTPRRWSGATPGGGVGSYTSFTESLEPSWFTLDGPTGKLSFVPGWGPKLPVNTTTDTLTLKAAASRAPDYLYLLHAAEIAGAPAALVQLIRVAPGGCSIYLEEVAPSIAGVVFDQGLRYDTPVLTLYGTDDVGAIYQVRKNWTQIGNAATPWEYFTGTGFSTDPLQAAPLPDVTTDGPLSFATVRHVVLMSTVTTVPVEDGGPVTPPTGPAPVSHFDFHEGSGSTTTSTVGGYVLTTPAPGTAWASGGGIKEHFTGAVGANALLTEWSVSFRFTMSGEPDGDGWILAHTSSGTSVWFGLAGTSSFPSRRIGIFSPGTEMSDDRLDIGTEYVIVYVFTAADTKVYANGTLFATLTGGQTNNLSQTQGLLFTNGDNDFSPLREVSFYDVALTAAQVSGAPAEEPDPPPTGGGAMDHVGRVYEARQGRPFRATATRVSLGVDDAYLGHGLALQPQLEVNPAMVSTSGAVSYVVSTKVTTEGESSLVNTWGLHTINL